MLADELRPQHQPADAFMAAVDFFRIVGEPDGFDHRAPAQRLRPRFDPATGQSSNAWILAGMGATNGFCQCRIQLA